MKTLTPILFLVVAASASSAHGDDAAAKYAEYVWSHKLALAADLNRDGVDDHVRLGVGSHKVGLLVRVDSTPLPIIEIPIGGSEQFGICSGSTPTIRVVPQSEAPLNALGQMPPGYEICPECIEIELVGGECDPLHFYWDMTNSKVAWWRA